MLDIAFYETPDYKTLLESHEKSIVIGRRGTGKSAIFYKLTKEYKTLLEAALLTYSPEDYEISALRTYLAAFSGNYNQAKSCAKIIAKFGLAMELIQLRVKHYKFQEIHDAAYFHDLVNSWCRLGETFFSRLYHLLRTHFFDAKTLADSSVAGLAEKLEIRRVERFIEAFFDFYNYRSVVMFDRLDEGYEHDTLGIAFLAGICDVIGQWNSAFPQRFRGVVFLRDNIARSIETADPDFSRNFESQIIRLHWGRYDLFNMACFRIRNAFQLASENNHKLWQSVTAQSLATSDGFDLCLRLTLYRPRDLLVLLNEAFNRAKKFSRDHIDESDVNHTAKEISSRRFNDLIKEYGVLIPGLEQFARAFTDASPKYTLTSAMDAMVPLMEENAPSPAAAQYCAILGNGTELLRSLYSIGFLGIRSKDTGNYSFCHDGKTTDVEFTMETELLVHPCYWIALNITETITEEARSEIDDEYDDLKIDISSSNLEQRKNRLGRLINSLTATQCGLKDCALFEEWCKEALRVVFSGSLSNLELHPNGASSLRRDIVARNTGNRSAWKRILEDYSGRQVIFEAKNYEDALGPDEFRQMSSYLNGPYGRLGFIINRSNEMNLVGGSELDWVRQSWNSEKKMIIKLNAKYLCKLLSKLRNPQKHDEPDESLNGLLDKYERLYLSLPSSGRKR